jgi:hypothetical protein
MENKKPDLVVFDNDNSIYDAAFREYPTDLAAPKIEMTNIVPWKQTNLKKVNTQLKAKFDQLISEYNKLLTDYEQNELVYNSKFNFEPIVGNWYHLYKNHREESFLSIIAPNECSFKHLGSFRLNSDKMWERL